MEFKVSLKVLKRVEPILAGDTKGIRSRELKRKQSAGDEDAVESVVLAEKGYLPVNRGIEFEHLSCSSGAQHEQDHFDQVHTHDLHVHSAFTPLQL